MRFPAYIIVFFTLSGLLGPMLGGCQEVTLNEWTAAENAGFQVGAHAGLAAAESDSSICFQWTELDGANWWTNNDQLLFELEVAGEFDPGVVGAAVENGYFAGFRAAYLDPELGFEARLLLAERDFDGNNTVDGTCCELAVQGNIYMPGCP